MGALLEDLVAHVCGEGAKRALPSEQRAQEAGASAQLENDVTADFV